MFAQRETTPEFGATAAGVVHTKGLRRCASPWSCPVCAPKIGETRADEIDQAIKAWMAAGNTVVFVTATLRHQLGDDLAGLLEMLQAAWSRTWRWSAPYYSKKTGALTNGDRVRPAWYGGQVRAVEITYGANGWHPHVHAAVFIPRGTGSAGVVKSLRFRWEESVKLLGGSTDVRSDACPGWDVRSVHSGSGLAGYLTKVEGGWSAGREIARADTKRKGITPWMLLAQAVAGDYASAVRFLIYDKATRGLRRIVASPGLLHLVEDEEAVEDHVDPDELVATAVLSPASWRKLLCRRLAASMLNDLAAIATGDLYASEWSWPAHWLRSVPMAGAPHPVAA